MKKGLVKIKTLYCIKDDYKSIRQIEKKTGLGYSSIDKALKKLEEKNEVDKKKIKNHLGQSIFIYKSLVVDDYFDSDYLLMLVKKYNEGLQNKDLTIPLIEKEMLTICKKFKVVDNDFTDFAIKQAKKDPIKNMIFLNILNEISNKLKSINDPTAHTIRKQIDDFMSYFDKMILDNSIDIDKRLEIYNVLTKVNPIRTFPLTIDLYRKLNSIKKFKGYNKKIHKKYSTEFHIFMSDLHENMLQYQKHNPIEFKSKLIDLLGDPQINNIKRIELEDISIASIPGIDTIRTIELPSDLSDDMKRESMKRGISFNQLFTEIMETTFKSYKFNDFIKKEKEKNNE